MGKVRRASGERAAEHAGSGAHPAIGADEPLTSSPGEIGDPSEPAEAASAPIGSLADVERELARTHASLASLATGVKEVLERQDRAARGVNLSSFGAYAIFTLLLAGGFTLLYRAQAGVLVTERDEAVAAHTKLTADVAASVATQAARVQAETRAAALWTVVESGRREELVARAAEADVPGLSPVETAALRRAIHDARRSLSDEASAAGREAQRGGMWGRSAEPFRRALAVEPEGPRRGELGYRLGLGLLRAGDAEGAVRALTDAAASGGEAAGADLYFLLGSANEARRDDVHAAEAYRRFAESHPDHSLAPTARARLRFIAARNGGPPVKPAAAPVPAPATPPRPATVIPGR